MNNPGCLPADLPAPQAGSKHISSEKLRSNLQQQDTPLPVEQEAIVPTETLRPLLECTICQEIFLRPYSLKCSHTFCSHCINKWLRQKKACPVCRAVVLRKPYYNRLVDNLCEKFEELMTKEEKEQRCRYKQEIMNSQIAAVQQFKEAAKEAEDNGTKFLNIRDTWNAKEKEVFRIGYDKYDGDDRIAYCELTGFNKELVETADEKTITTMLNNLGVEVPRYISVVPVKYDYEMARAILMDILLG
jgi:hypothetical protein